MDQPEPEPVPEPLRQRSGPRLTRLLLECLTVLLGVFLALLADEWREERQLDAEAAAVQDRLDEEIIANFAQLIDLQLDIEDRYARLTAVGAAMNDERAFDEYASCFVGYRFAQFNEAAWGRASLDRIGSRIEAAYMADAAELYSWNRVFDDLSDPLNRLLYSPGYFDPAQARISYRLAERLVWQQRSWARTMDTTYAAFTRQWIPTRVEHIEQERVQARSRWAKQSAERDLRTRSERPWCLPSDPSDQGESPAP